MSPIIERSASFREASERVLCGFDRLASRVTTLRPWHLRELHNPWSRAASEWDAWEILVFCESGELIAPVMELLGRDIILFDSELKTSASYQGGGNGVAASEAWQFPIEPAAGAVLRLGLRDSADVNISFGAAGTGTEGAPAHNDAIAVRAGQVICHRMDAVLSASCSSAAHKPCELLIRYYPASSRYLRDSTHPLHQVLMERLPMFNFVTMPLWLVHGVDKAGNDFVTGFNPRTGRWITTGGRK